MADHPTSNSADEQGHKRVVEVGMVPDDPAGNWSYTLTRDGAGLVTDVQATKDGITYKADVTRDVNDKVTGLGAWAKQ
jgi:hypothetical protein